MKMLLLLLCYIIVKYEGVNLSICLKYLTGLNCKLILIIYRFLVSREENKNKMVTLM